MAALSPPPSPTGPSSPLPAPALTLPAVQTLLDSYDYVAAQWAFFEGQEVSDYALDVLLRAAPSLDIFLSLVHHYLHSCDLPDEWERSSSVYDAVYAAFRRNPSTAVLPEDEFLYLVWYPAVVPLTESPSGPASPGIPLNAWTDTLFEHLLHFHWHPYGFPFPVTFPTRPDSTYVSAHRAHYPYGSPSPPLEAELSPSASSLDSALLCTPPRCPPPPVLPVPRAALCAPSPTRSSPDSQFARDMATAFARSTSVEHQAGLFSQALALQNHFGTHRVTVHREGHQGWCNPVACSGILQLVHPTVDPDMLSALAVRTASADVVLDGLPMRMLPPMLSHPAYRNAALPIDRDECRALGVRDVEAHPTFTHYFHALSSTPDARNRALHSLIAGTTFESDGTAVSLTGDLTIFGSNLLLYRLQLPPVGIYQTHLSMPTLQDHLSLVESQPPGSRIHLLCGDAANHHFVGITLTHVPTHLPPPVAAPLSPAPPRRRDHHQPQDAPFSGDSPPHSHRRPQRPFPADASSSTPPHFRVRCATYRYRGFHASDTWEELDSDSLWRARLRRLHAATNRDLQWVLAQFPSFHRLCFLHTATSRTSAATQILLAITAADAATRSEESSSIFVRVRTLQLPPPKPILGLDYELRSPTSPPSRGSSTSPRPPLALLPGTGACPPGGPACCAAPPESSAAPSRLRCSAVLPVASRTALPPPPLFCRADGSRKSLFGKLSTGLYTTAKDWNAVLRTVSSASRSDLEWLLHHQWPRLHQLCIHRASNPHASPVLRALTRATGGSSLVLRICDVPAPLRCPASPSLIPTGESYRTHPTTPPAAASLSDSGAALSSPPTPACSASSRTATRGASGEPSASDTWDLLPVPHLFPALPASPTRDINPALLLPTAPPTVTFPAADGQVVLFCDGGVQRNDSTDFSVSRPAGAGFALYRVEAQSSRLIPLRLGGVWLGDASTNTNNVAEYQALCWGLQHATQLQARDLIIVSDSQLLVRQMTTQYRVACPTLLALHQRARHLAASFHRATITWRRRDHVAVADRLANLATAFQSSHWWTGERPWSAALTEWRAQRSLAPSPYLTTDPDLSSCPAPLFHSAAQVSAFLDSAVQGTSTMAAHLFQRLLSSTLSRASLPGPQLHHGSHLYNWTRIRCSSRPLRSAAPTDVFTVHIDTTFDAFWTRVLVDAQLRPSTRCLNQRPQPTPSRSRPTFPNLQWVNPAVLSPPATPAVPAVPSGTSANTTTTRPRSSCSQPQQRRRASPAPPHSPRQRRDPSNRSTRDRPSERRRPSGNRRRHNHRASRDSPQLLRPTRPPRAQADRTPPRCPPPVSHLVTVKWVPPEVTDHCLLERLRNAGLFIPAGTYVHPGYDQVRVLEFPRSRDVVHLLATKGAVLKGRLDTSLNPATTQRRLSYSEHHALLRYTCARRT